MTQHARPTNSMATISLLQNNLGWVRQGSCLKAEQRLKDGILRITGPYCGWLRNPKPHHEMKPWLKKASCLLVFTRGVESLVQAFAHACKGSSRKVTPCLSAPAAAKREAWGLCPKLKYQSKVQRDPYISLSPTNTKGLAKKRSAPFVCRPNGHTKKYTVLQGGGTARQTPLGHFEMSSFWGVDQFYLRGTRATFSLPEFLARLLCLCETPPRGWVQIHAFGISLGVGSCGLVAHCNPESSAEAVSVRRRMLSVTVAP